MNSPLDPLAELRAALPARFAIDDYIDKGGQGAVFRGSYEGRPAAIKLFAPGSDPRRLEREVALLAGIRNQNLVQLLGHDVVTVQGVTGRLVAYEYHGGGDLRRLLDGALPPVSRETLYGIARALATAVEVLWSKRIVHRDIKPANIVQAADGRFVVVDVGLARFLDRSDVTRPGMVAGTRGYMSPEQAMGRRALTMHSDVFAIGITLHELGARAHPFARDQDRICAGTAPPSLAATRPDLPQGFRDLVRLCMSMRPADRPRDIIGRLDQLMEV